MQNRWLIFKYSRHNCTTRLYLASFRAGLATYTKDPDDAKWWRTPAGAYKYAGFYSQLQWHRVAQA